MKNHSVRPVRPDDVQALLKMVHALAEHHGDTPQSSMEILKRDCLGPHPWLHVLIAETASEILGYAALCPLSQMQFGARGMDIHHLYVLGDARGQGVGQALIRACVEKAKRLECRYMTVGTHPDNRRAAEIYVRAGFEPLSPPGPRFRITL